MKIIEFKGKLKASQEWAYGNLCKRIDGGYIVTPDETPIENMVQYRKEQNHNIQE